MSVMNRFRLDGKVAVVTGASSGLGVAFAKALAEAGAISSGLFGNPIGNDMVVVANPAIHGALVAILEANQADRD